MSIHVCKCEHSGRTEYHLRYPGMSESEAQGLADRINSGCFDREARTPNPASKLIGAKPEDRFNLEAEVQQLLRRSGFVTNSQASDLSELVVEFFATRAPTV